MPSKKVCSIAFQQALQEKLGYTPSQIEKLREEYFKTVKQVESDYGKYKASDAYAEAVKLMLDKKKIENINKKRQALRNAEKRLAMAQFIITNYPDDYQTGVDKFMQLVHYSKEAKASSYLADFKRNLLGHDGFGEDYTRQLASGQYDKMIMQELFYIDNPDAAARDKHLMKPDGSFTGDPIAKRLADIIYRAQKVAVQDAIDAGADIHLIKGYMVKQTHNMDKFLSKKYGNTVEEKRAHWKKFIMARLDMEKTFGDLPADFTPDDMLNGIWDNITKGKHLAYIPEEISFIPGKNVAKRAAAERKLFFKDGTAAYEYNIEYGAENVREAVLFQLDNMANTTVLLNYMGTNPRYNFEAAFKTLHNTAREENNLKNLNYLKKGAGAEAPSLTESAHNQLSDLLGEDRIPGSVSMARINSMLRAMNNVAFLGGSLLTAFMDLASSPTVAHLQGRGRLGAFTDAIKGLSGVYNHKEYVDALDSIGFIGDAFLGSIAQKTIGRFNGDYDLSRQAGYITNSFFKWNGLRWWTDAIRAAHTIGMSRDLAKQAKFKFSELNVNTQDFLKRFNISEKEWDVLRTFGTRKAINGEQFMLNKHIEDLSDKTIAQVFDIRYDAPKKPTTENVARATRIYTRAIKEARQNLADKLQTLLLASGMETVLLPTVTEVGTAKRAAAPGTAKGELFRHFFQFKQFPLALYNIILKGIAREYKEAGPLEAAKTGAIFMVGMMATAYISMTAKDLCHNRTPRDITDPKVLAELVVRSGMLSIYGDLLFNDTSRSPYEIMGTLMGPTASSAGELSQILSKAMFKGENVADDLVKFGVQRAPAIGMLHPATTSLAYVNLFYFKPFLDYMIYNNLNELLNPGYNQRVRARLLKQGRDYLVQPQY